MDTWHFIVSFANASAMGWGYGSIVALIILFVANRVPPVKKRVDQFNIITREMCEFTHPGQTHKEFHSTTSK